jgi:hypothetical protein
VWRGCGNNGARETPQRAELKEEASTEKELGNLKGTRLECVNERRALGRESFLI